MKKWLVLMVVASLLMVGCQSNSDVVDLAQVEERGYVVVGLDDTFAPMGFRLDDGSLTGFDVELATEVFSRMGIEVKFQPIEWSMKEAELNNGNIDMIWNGYTITEERQKKVAFSTPYLKNRQIIITLADSGIASYEELAGKIIACQSESSSEEAIMKDAKLVGMMKDGTPVTFSTNQEAFLDLEAGRIDAVVADEVLAMYYISANNAADYKVLSEDLGKEEYGIGFRKGSVELAKKVNDTLKEMYSDGFAAEVSTKWFSRDITGE